MKSILKQTNVSLRLVRIFRRELRIFSHRPLFLFTMIVAPILCIVFFTTLMADGLPTKLPAGLVDEDDTHNCTNPWFYGGNRSCSTLS